ncbi:uncharacterized protein [Aristolochia californica]
MKVEFGSSKLEDIITDKEEAHARLRSRSSPLERGECFGIEGVPVLVMNRTRGNLLFDAEVLKVRRVRHSNKVHCRCEFEIRWLHPELKGETASVPSTSIRKLSRDNIENHPIVAEFLKSMIPLIGSDLPLDVTSHGGSSETNFHELLQKQIEDITKLAEMSNSTQSEDLLFEIKRVDPIRDTQSNIFDSSNISGKGLRRSTRIQNKQFEIIKNDPYQCQLTQEDNLDFKIPLSPLAARAALASLARELPVYHMKQEKVKMSPSKNTPGGNMQRVECDVTCTLFNSQVCSQQKVSLNGQLSPDIPNPVWAKGDKCGEKPLEESQSRNSSKKITSNNSELKEKCLERQSTGTCSETQKKIGAVVRNLELQLPAGQKKMQKMKRDSETNVDSTIYRIRQNLSTVRRLTRSVVKKEVENSSCRFGELVIPEDKQTEKEKSLFSSVDCEGHAHTETSKRKLGFSGSTIAITAYKDNPETNVVGVDSSTEDRMPNDLTTMRRLTRSAGQQEREYMFSKQSEFVIRKGKKEIKKKYLSSYVGETQQTMKRKRLKGFGAAETVCNNEDNKEDMEVKMESSPKGEKQNSHTTLRLTRSAVQRGMKDLSSKTQELDTSKDDGTMKKKSFLSHVGYQTSAAQGFTKKKRMRASCGHEPVFCTEHNDEVDLTVKTQELVASSVSSLHNHILQRASDFRRITRSQGKLQLETRRGLTPACIAHNATSTQGLPHSMNSLCIAEQVKTNAGAAQDTRKKNLKILSLDGTRTFINSTICIQENVTVIRELSSDCFRTSVSQTAESGEYRDSLEESSSKNCASKWSRVDKRLLRIPSGPEKQPVIESVNTRNAVTKFTRLVTDRTSKCTTVTTRLTRSKLQKEMENSIAKIKLESLRRNEIGTPTNWKKSEDSINKGKTDLPGDRPRSTRLAPQKEVNTAAGKGDFESLSIDGKLNRPTTRKSFTKLASQ